jgi:hypothetical protein
LKAISLNFWKYSFEVSSPPHISFIDAVRKSVSQLDSRRHLGVTEEGSWEHMLVRFSPVVPMHEGVETNGDLPIRLVVYSIEKENRPVLGEFLLHEDVHSP